MQIFAIIPARSGSKSIKNKNIRKIFGKPLLAHSIEIAKKSKLIQRVFVSSDSKKILNISNKYGAETILRPKKISKDNSIDFEYLNHFINKTKPKGKTLIVILRPTAPIRNLKTIENAIKSFYKSNFDSLRSVSVAEQSPYKMWVKEKSLLKPLMGKKFLKFTNFPRQKLKKIYWQNGYIDITTNETLNKFKNELGLKIKFFEIKNKIIEIDYLYQLNEANKNKMKKVNLSKINPA